VCSRTRNLSLFAANPRLESINPDVVLPHFCCCHCCYCCYFGGHRNGLHNHRWRSWWCGAEGFKTLTLGPSPPTLTLARFFSLCFRPADAVAERRQWPAMASLPFLSLSRFSLVVWVAREGHQMPAENPPSRAFFFC